MSSYTIGKFWTNTHISKINLWENMKTRMKDEKRNTYENPTIGNQMKSILLYNIMLVSPWEYNNTKRPLHNGIYLINITCWQSCVTNIYLYYTSIMHN